jgi:hypothetical protein
MLLPKLAHQDHCTLSGSTTPKINSEMAAQRMAPGDERITIANGPLAVHDAEEGLVR